jgi:hypothetical protein
MHGFVRSAIMLTACTFAVALLLAPFALRQAGSSGPLGLLAAAAICLFSGLAAAGAVTRSSPVGAALIAMMVRMFVPLGVCVALLATDHSGRDHLPFIGYLLTFYMLTLGLETCLAVKRSAASSSNSTPSAR